jgi:serine/threonine protein kinase
MNEEREGETQPEPRSDPRRDVPSATITGKGPRRWRHVGAARAGVFASPKRKALARSGLRSWSTTFDPADLMPRPDGSPDAAPSMLQIDKYRIEEVIGAGGMAVVHRAREISTGRDVALKIMPEHYAQDERRIARFRREMRANARLNHENIVRILDFGADDDRLYLAAEFVDGGTLHDLLGIAPRIPPVVAALFIDDLLSGLVHAHAKGLIHRDLKPANLLLTKEGRLKINDFGIAVADGEPTLTAPGDIVGTPSYMSPEQAIGMPLTPASDLFSVGTILYEMITGMNPFAHISQSLTLASVASGHVMPLFEIDPTVPAAIERVLDALIEADPSRRCQTAEEALALLRLARSEMPSPPADLVRRFVSNPRVTVDLLRTEQASAEIDAARVLLLEGEKQSARAAFLAYCATMLKPHDTHAYELQTLLCEQFGYCFLSAPSPALRAMEAMMYEMPDAEDILKQAGVVARADGDLLRAAILFKRHLRLCPNDDDTRARLASIVGDAHARPTQWRPARHPGVHSAAEPTLPEGGHRAVRDEKEPAHIARGLKAPDREVMPLAATLFPKTTVFVAAAAWLGTRLVSRHKKKRESPSKSAKSDVERKSARAEIARRRRTPVSGALASDVPEALAVALRMFALAPEPFAHDAKIRMLLERAACSFGLAQQGAALADISASISMMSRSDSRRNTLSTVVAALHNDT